MMCIYTYMYKYIHIYCYMRLFFFVKAVVFPDTFCLCFGIASDYSWLLNWRIVVLSHRQTKYNARPGRKVSLFHLNCRHRCRSIIEPLVIVHSPEGPGKCPAKRY